MRSGAAAVPKSPADEFGRPGPRSAVAGRSRRKCRAFGTGDARRSTDNAEAAPAGGKSSETAADVVEIPGDAALGSDAEEPHDQAAESPATAEATGERAETEHPESSEADQSAHDHPAETAEAAASNEAREQRRQRRGRRSRRRDRRVGRRRRRDGGSSRPRAALSPPVQDPGGDQAPPGHAGAGGQGGARHQGRGADDLSVARRPLFGADAEYRARRRHQPQDHQCQDRARLKEAAAGTRSAGGHGRHPAHRRRQPHQDRDQARFRISAADVGDGPRSDAEIDRAQARL